MMVVAVLFLLSCLSLLIWCVLLFARGGFWRARPATPLVIAPLNGTHDNANGSSGAWPAVAAVVPS